MFRCGLRYDVHGITWTSPFSVFVMMDDPIQIAAKDLAGTKNVVIFIFPQCNLNTLALFAFTQFYLQVLADGNGIILRLKRNVILRKAIKCLTAEFERLKNLNHT